MANQQQFHIICGKGISMEIRNLLFQEKFRQLLLENDMANEFVLSRSVYSNTSYIVGCFFDGTNWIVYENDERAHHNNVVAYGNIIDAYQEAANRRGLDFNAKEAYFISEQDQLVYAQNAYKHWAFLSNRYKGSESENNALANQKMLSDFVRERELSTSKPEKASFIVKPIGKHGSVKKIAERVSIPQSTAAGLKYETVQGGSEKPIKRKKTHDKIEDIPGPRYVRSTVSPDSNRLGVSACKSAKTKGEKVAEQGRQKVKAGKNRKGRVVY